MDRREPQVKQYTSETTIRSNGNILRKQGVRIAGTAAAAVLALALVGCGATANAEGPEKPTTSASEAPTPTETEAPVEAGNNMGAYENDPAVTPENEAALLAELQFTADMAPDQLAEHYNEVTSRWVMAGATPETWETWFNDSTGLTVEAIAQQVAEQNAPVYATALYGENYTNFITPSQLEDDIKKNAINITRFISTFGTDEFPNASAENTEAWHSTTNVVSVEPIQESESQTAIVVVRELQSNAEKTMFADEADGYNGYQVESALTFSPAADNPAVRVITSQNVAPVQ